ncbi:hypothetical protein [Halobacillus karajensis]|uniref:Uncharacterized protein n=1 Tax=Halobacillus karajensis TaxID=195088 RepID=A0A059NZ46_9BACI|nr:hypothetical protein [Halobacillus karajensis]CDQ18877.1 hypothetical protein BN982_01158 [Halobacillus karajensis]CDQ23050.1 hypothetical protein BN983_01269 [Halobacillus karajensis]CDQ26532.1 hypothetical protein BN981_00749 [Halobacillus karajensis]
MREIILLLADVVNVWHDVIWKLTDMMGWELTDKDLHFWVIGILGIIGLIFVDLLFHALAKWSISVISFLFTFAMVLVFVFAVEIQQKIMGSGNMEFADAVASLLGFFLFCGIYFVLLGISRAIKRYRNHKNEDNPPA